MLLPEQLQGEKATLDALEKRAKEALARLEHPTDRDHRQRAVPELRRRLAAAIGIERLPQPQPRSVRLVGTVDRGDYVIEKIVYETFPGCLVAAHVYRAAKIEGRLPAILFPPGHYWAPGKAHPDTQAFAITMARWGFVVLIYDPHGEGERGISMRDHRRTELLLAGLSQQAVPVFESRCALEYLLSRKDVDPQRIGITGESGGGFNSWIMTALEPRIAVSVPVVGTSEFFEQTQICRTTDFYLANEHCHFIAGLFRFANNHEFLALAAPRPVLVIAAHNDYNFRIPGIRQVVAYGRKLYEALGKLEQLGYFEDKQTAHGYQKPKRQAAYGWFRRWLQHEGHGEPIPEPEVKTAPADAAELRCFPAGQNQPAGPGIIAQVHRLTDRLPVAQEPPPAQELQQALREALGLEVAQADTQLQRGRRRLEGGAIVERLEWRAADGVSIPALLIGLPGARRGAVLANADAGKESLLTHAGIRSAVESGWTVVAVDVRGTGELVMKKPGWVFATSLMLGENFVGRQALDLIAGRRALAAIPELKGKPVGLLGSGPFTSQAALYAAALDSGFDWLVTEGGFLSFRSFVDRPISLRDSYRLATTFDAAWDVIDQEIPASLYVFDILKRLDLPDLYGLRASRPVLVVSPIDGDRQVMPEAVAIKLLGAGRFRWPKLPTVVTGKEAERSWRGFLANQAAPFGRGTFSGFGILSRIFCPARSL
jgi:cephalosporin-C deacetylase-like acetyl esterase